MAKSYWYLYILTFLICCHDSAMARVSLDGSYVKVGASEQYSANGNIQIRSGLEVIGQYSRSSGKDARYKYGIDSEQNYWGLITEGRGFVYDDHRVVGWTIGLTWKGFQVHSGSSSEWSAIGSRTTLFNVGSEFELNKDHMSLDMRLDYVSDKDGEDRWDYASEMKKYFRVLYLSGRMSHIRGVIRQALTMGVEF